MENRDDGTGALCFDVDGRVPTCVVYDNGVTDLLVWEIIASVLITHQKRGGVSSWVREWRLDQLSETQLTFVREGKVLPRARAEH
ncbi:DUF1942 domain-containing protein [Mycobacteroides franklinii]|uniref:DUF1942 domain-containing protein n=1 Tax=Mycobacteroides franklinii TaxID=948102 RepID=UPI000993FAA0